MRYVVKRFHREADQENTAHIAVIWYRERSRRNLEKNTEKKSEKEWKSWERVSGRVSMKLRINYTTKGTDVSKQKGVRFKTPFYDTK